MLLLCRRLCKHIFFVYSATQREHVYYKSLHNSRMYTSHYGHYLYVLLIVGKISHFEYETQSNIQVCNIQDFELELSFCMFEVHQYNQNHSLKRHKENMFTITLFSFLLWVKQYNRIHCLSYYTNKACGYRGSANEITQQ